MDYYFDHVVYFQPVHQSQANEHLLDAIHYFHWRQLVAAVHLEPLTLASASGSNHDFPRTQVWETVIQ